MADSLNPSTYDIGHCPSMDPSLEGYSEMEDDLNDCHPHYVQTNPWTGSQYNYDQVHYNLTAPNVNQWTGSETYAAPAHNNPDDEVSYFSNFDTWSNVHNQAYNRCSSTDTTFSNSSQSTVLSHNSVNEPDNIVDCDTLKTQKGQKRKRCQNEAKQPKQRKKTPSLFPYKRWPKPPYSYHGVIATVIWNSKNKALSLNDIHSGMMELFPFFRGSYKGWRDSVRNYLSKTSCFVKVSSGSKALPNLWTVDVTKLTCKMFERQENNKEAVNYKATIHEHLDLPPIHIPGHEYKIKQRKKNVQSIRLSELGTQTPKCNQKITEMENVNQFNVTLPSVENCLTQAESPFSTYAYKRQESGQVEDLTFSKPDAVSSDVLTSPPSRLNLDGFSYPASLYDFRRLVECEPRSSTDAVTLLHSLCFADTNDTESVNVASELPILPSDRDSDAQMSQYLNSDDSLETEEANGLKRCYTGFSISGLFSPPSPVVSSVRSETGTELSSEKNINSDNLERL